MIPSLYIDAGSGSAVIQMAIGVLVGAGFAVKIYWNKIRYRFSRKNDD